MKGIIINWIDTLASIPADWLLCDGANSTPNLLGKYLLGASAGVDPGTTGGSATHTHSTSAHNHTQDTHSHSGNTSEANGNQAGAFPGSSSLAREHTHTYTSSSTVAVNQEATVTAESASNDPAYYKVAPIIDNSVSGVKYPATSLIFWGQTTLPLGWSACDGSSGTPDLRNKFLKCVDSAENPGATGGSATHTHSTTAHNHTQNSHGHTATTGGSNSCTSYNSAVSGALACSHSHTITVGEIAATNQTAAPTMDTINGEPTFKKLLILKNTGVANRPKYAIVLWTGTIANIPLGYVLCDGTNSTPDLRDYFIKGALDSSEIASTGGSSVHGHTANSHNHTQDAHNHSGTIPNYTTLNASYDGGDGGGIDSAHQHPNFDLTSVTATNQATTITISNCSSQANYPPFYKVAYIMQDRELDVGAYAFMIN